MIDRRHLLLTLAALSAPALLRGRPAAAEAASAWSRDMRSSLRLIGAGSEGEGASLRHRAGLQIRLEPGTKTYWRTPGDSGVPPLFDWSASRNLAEISLAWPAPIRFSDGGGQSIGYKTDVVFPVLVRPADPAQPVHLAAKVDYAVCETICIPAKGETRLTLAAGPAPDTALAGEVARFAGQVPRPAVDGLSLALAAVEPASPHPVATLVADVGAETGRIDLFAEGPDPQWALPLPEPLDQEGARRRFRLTLDGAPRGVAPLGHLFTFTLVAGSRALEAQLKIA